MPPENTPSPAPVPDSAITSVLRELLDCTELNLDEIEDHTRAVIEKARALLSSHLEPREG